MTTKRQIRKLLDQVADRHSDLIVKGPYLVLRPQRHVLRSISIDRTWRADLPRFYWHIGHAFNPSGTLQGLAREIFWLPKEGPRYWGDTDFAEAVIEKFEQSILPMLRRVQTIEDMFHVEGEPRSAEYDSWLTFNPFRIAMSAALGHWEAALAVYEKTKKGSIPSWQRWSHQKAFELGNLMASGDRPGAVALLHQWEDEFVVRNGLEDIYEPTPFPLEQL